MTRILCLWLPNWPIERLVHAQSELNDRPVVLFRQDHRGRWVVACSASAARRGIRPDMPLAEATALAGAQLHLALFDPPGDREALEQLAHGCGQFSPLVGLEESDPERPDSLLLEIDGTAPLWGGEESLAQEIVAALGARRWRVRAAVADTIGAAWGVARYGCITSSAPRHVPPGKLSAALGPLPIEALRLPPETSDLLHDLGVETIAQLMKLPRAGLATRLGPMVTRRLDQALGSAVETIAGYRPPPEFEASQVFEYLLEQRNALDRVLAELLEQLVQRLIQHGRGVMQLECQIDCQTAHQTQEIRLPVGIFQPLAVAPHLLELLDLQLERRVLPGPIVAVRLAVFKTAPLSARQQELFADPRECEAPRQLGRLVDRLSSRLGREAVLRPFLAHDAQPECACRYEPLTGKPSSWSPRARATQKKSAPAPRAWRRSLRLERRPIPLAVDVVSLYAGGAPAQLRWKQQHAQVARAWGPERIYTGWWRGRSVRRDYYRVETTTGHRLWLFRRLEDGQWFLHGRFD